MKKLLLLAALLCGITMNVKADPEELTFTVEIVGNGGTNPTLPKSPVNLPQATLDGHMLTFTTSHPDYTLTLLDEDGDEAYQVFVPASTSVVVLPSTLSGSIKLQLDFGGSYIFVSEIVL